MALVIGQSRVPELPASIIPFTFSPLHYSLPSIAPGVLSHMSLATTDESYIIARLDNV